MFAQTLLSAGGSLIIVAWLAGYYGTERSERSLKDFPVKDVDADEEKQFKKEMSKWKRSDTGGYYLWHGHWELFPLCGG